jgi:hypothetical protein
VDLLAVQAGGVAVGDRGEHDAIVVGVEQRNRCRLVAGHLVVGVIAHERAVGDRAVEAVLGGGHARVQALGDLLDARVQRFEGRLQRARVRDQVGLPVRAEHGLLGAAYPSHAQAQDQQPDQRDQRRARRGKRDNSGRVIEIRHGREANPARTATGTTTCCCRSSSRRGRR